MVFLEESFEKVNFEKKNAKKHAKLHSRQIFKDDNKGFTEGFLYLCSRYLTSCKIINICGIKI